MRCYAVNKPENKGEDVCSVYCWKKHSGPWKYINVEEKPMWTLKEEVGLLVQIGSTGWTMRVTVWVLRFISNCKARRNASCFLVLQTQWWVRERPGGYKSWEQEGDKEVQWLQSMLKDGEIVLMVGDEKNNGERKKGTWCRVHLPHPS